MSLSCGYEDFDRPEFFEEREVRARKQHVCCECGATIEPGEEYVRIVGKWDGTIDVYKTCWKCYGLEQSLAELGFCFCYSELYNAYKEYLDEYTKAVSYDEETDEYLYPENNLIARDGSRAAA